MFENEEADEEELDIEDNEDKKEDADDVKLKLEAEEVATEADELEVEKELLFQFAINEHPDIYSNDIKVKNINTFTILFFFIYLLLNMMKLSLVYF